MGLFSGKKKTHVNTSVSRMVDDKDFVPSNKLAILEYTMSEDSSSASLDALTLPDYLIRTTSNNVVARARKAINYSKKPEYYYGRPQSNLVSQAGVDVKGAVQDELERIYPQGVVTKFAVFGPMNNFFFMKTMLSQKYGYDYDTNELVDESTRIGFKCYMDTAVIIYSKYSTDVLIDPNTLIQHGSSAEAGFTPFRPANSKAKQVPWISNGTKDMDTAEVTVCYKDASGTKQTYKIILDFLEYEPSSKPIEDGLDDSDTNNFEPNAVTPEVPKQLMGQDYYMAEYEYQEGSVTKTGLFTYMYGAGFNSRLDKLFNVIDEFGSYIPRVYARMNGRKSNEEADKDKPEYKSMVGLGRQLGMNWTSWVDEVHKSVGSVGDVTQIFMTYSLPANTTDPLIREYMFEYFLGLYGRIPDTFANSDFKDLNDAMINYGSKQGQSIEIKDNAYSQQLNFSSIGYIDIRGSIGAIGTVDSGMGTQTIYTGRPTIGNVRSTSTSTHHYYRKQMTANTYREVRVYGLSTTEHVNGGYTTTASGDSENLLIPLDLAVDHEFNNKQKEALYTKAMYIVLHTIKVVKTKWYQTGIFKAIMFVVAVVASVFTGGQALTLYAIMYAVVQTIVVGLVIQLAVKLLVVKLNINVGVVAAVIAVIAAVYGGYHALTKTTGMAGMTAPQLLNTAGEAFKISSSGYALQAKEAIRNFNSLMADLSIEAQEIQRQAEELGTGTFGALLMFEPPIGVGIRIGESPDDYYSRSIHTGNLGSAIYSVTDNYVDLNLRLPTQVEILQNIQEIYE